MTSNTDPKFEHLANSWKAFIAVRIRSDITRHVEQDDYIFYIESNHRLSA